MASDAKIIVSKFRNCPVMLIFSFAQPSDSPINCDDCHVYKHSIVGGVESLRGDRHRDPVCDITDKHYNSSQSGSVEFVN